jgi:hypothetical protein
MFPNLAGRAQSARSKANSLNAEVVRRNHRPPPAGAAEFSRDLFRCRVRVGKRHRRTGTRAGAQSQALGTQEERDPDDNEMADSVPMAS